MSCGMIVMLKAGIDIIQYDAYEIDKYAIKTSQHNFPQILHHGDVFEADFKIYEGVDYLIGGSPCTYWSIAQKNNRETQAEGLGWELFQQYVRALNEAKPKFFIYENNKSMSKEIRKSIDDAFGFEAVHINSALVSAQNRQRLYWVGRKTPNGSYVRVDISQPKDRGIILKDILDSRTCGDDEQKSNSPVKLGEVGNGGQGNRIYSINGKSVAQTANSGGIGSNTGLYAEPIESTVRIGALPRPNGELSTSQAMRIYSINGKSVNLTSCGGGLGGKTGLYACPIYTDNLSGHNDKIYNAYEVKDGLITIKGRKYPIKLSDGYYIIRKLTVSECKRLQTVPEWYEFPVSDAQAYKMLGNGWTCDVIQYLIENTLLI